MADIDRGKRALIVGSASVVGLAATGCTVVQEATNLFAEGPSIGPEPNYRLAYGPKRNEKFPIPAVDISRVPRRFLRRQVSYRTKHPVGTVVVNTSNYHLYLVQPGGRAMRYGVGLGRQGFEWSGRGVIQWKQRWPTWTPPKDMIERQPELAKWSAENGGMPPGLKNPLGARALYIFQNGRDTLYRLHGSPEYWSIGKAVSSGCVRLMNQDIIDLYGRVPPKAALIVI